jgi:hypothetical protein
MVRLTGDVLSGKINGSVNRHLSCHMKNCKFKNKLIVTFSYVVGT